MSDIKVASIHCPYSEDEEPHITALISYVVEDDKYVFKTFACCGGMHGPMQQCLDALHTQLYSRTVERIKEAEKEEKFDGLYNS